MQVWDNLQITAASYPVKGNMEGSFVTMFSSEGLIFGIINIIGEEGKAAPLCSGSRL